MSRSLIDKLLSGELPLVDLQSYVIAGHWDGQHCPVCGSETWLPLGDDKMRCLSCRVEWESSP